MYGATYLFGRRSELLSVQHDPPFTLLLLHDIHEPAEKAKASQEDQYVKHGKSKPDDVCMRTLEGKE